VNMPSYADCITRITSEEATPLDDVVSAADPRCDPIGRDLFFPEMPPVLPDARMARPDVVAIGIRIDTVRGDLPRLALQLAALALEKECQIVVLTTLPYSGLERFGFRTERIAGATEDERAACEAQIRAFWNIELVI
jgi:hypothetical protein